MTDEERARKIVQDWYGDEALVSDIAAALAAERERYARECDKISSHYWELLGQSSTQLVQHLREKGHQTAGECAAAIRALGEEK